MRPAAPFTSMALLALVAASTAPAAAQHRSGATTSSVDEGAGEAAPEPPPPDCVIVLVESARRAMRPEAVRAALQGRVEGAVVCSLDQARGAVLAIVLVELNGDGSGALRVVSGSGRSAEGHLDADPDANTPAEVAARVAVGIESLLRATDTFGGPSTGAAEARHGLIPWHYDGPHQAGTDGIRLVDDHPLLPWPQGDAARRGEPPRRAPGTESGAGLTAPAPRAQNR